MSDRALARYAAPTPVRVAASRVYFSNSSQHHLNGVLAKDNLSLAKTRSRDWTRSWPRATLEQCPSFSLYWALCAPQSALPAGFLERVGKLARKLAKDPAHSTPFRVTRAAGLRMALLRGVEALEADLNARAKK